jgi:hypothetical protein
MGYSFLVLGAAGVAQASEASRSEAGSPQNDCVGERRHPGLRMTGKGRRSHPGQILLVDQADQLPPKINFVATIGSVFESHQFAYKSSSHKTQTPLPFDMPAVAHTPYFASRWIFQFLELLRKRTTARPIKIRRNFLPQRFVWTLLIVNTYPHADPTLLCPHAPSRWSSYFLFQDAMHLLVRTVVLGMRWPNKFHRNSQAQPPHAQAREAQSPLAPERCSIVHPDDFGQAVTAKNLRKRPMRRRLALVGNQHHRQHIATEQIADGQRFAPPSVARAKPAFEIYTPHLVRASRHAQRSIGQYRTPTRAPFALAHRSALPQPQRQSAHRRHAFNRRKFFSQHHPQLLWTPQGTRLAGSKERIAPKTAMGFCPVTRRSRTILECPYSPLPIALQPFVTALATDPKPTTQRREGFDFFPRGQHKSPSRLRHRNFFPRHRCPRKCHLCH